MPRQRSVALAVAALGLVLAFTLFRPASTGGPIERDFEAYYAAGATVDAGGDPYSGAIWRAERRVPGVERGRDEVLPFVGPAAALPLWALLARLPYTAAVVVWALVLVACGALIVGAALRVAGAGPSTGPALLATLMTIASAPLLGSLALGQAALPSAAGIAAAIVAYRARHAPRAIGATLLASLQPNIAITLIARVRTRWDLRVAALAAVLFSAATLAFGGGFAGALRYFQHLSRHDVAERFVAIQHTPAAIAYAAGLTPMAATLTGTLVAIAALATAIIVIRHERLDATNATLVAGALLPLAVPFFHEQDFVVEIVPLIVLAIRSTGTARRLGSVAATLVLVDWFGLAQRHGAQGQIVCLGAVVMCGFAGAGRLDRHAWRANAAGIALLVVLGALAVPLAHAHRAPVWPDDLPRHYRLGRGGDVSAMWGAQERAAGLTRRDPVWAALRALPLTGCVVLTWALVAEARRRRRLIATLAVQTPSATDITAPPLAAVADNSAGAASTTRFYDEAIIP